jgi:hypothetical protein
MSLVTSPSNVIPTTPLPGDYLSARFPHLHSIITDLENHSDIFRGSAYTHYTRFIVIQSVCTHVDLDINRPALHVEVDLGVNGGISFGFTLRRDDVIKWAGTVPGTFDNKKRIMQAVQRAVKYFQQRQEPGNILLLRELQGLAKTPQELLNTPVYERPASIMWQCTKLQGVVRPWIAR